MKALARKSGTRLRTWQLALGDVIAISLFAPIGLISHDKGITLEGLARNALPVGAGFLAAALLLGVYRRRSLASLAAAWALGVTAGVFVRAAILGHGYGRTTFTFLIVTLIVTGLLLAIWRCLLALLTRRR